MRPFFCVLALVLAASFASAQEDGGGSGPAFREGDTITFEDVDKLKSHLPTEFWANRDFFFGYSPERANPGDPELSLELLDRLAGLVGIEIEDVRVDAVAKHHGYTPPIPRAPPWRARGKEPSSLCEWATPAASSSARETLSSLTWPCMST